MFLKEKEGKGGREDATHDYRNSTFLWFYALQTHAALPIFFIIHVVSRIHIFLLLLREYSKIIE